MSAPLLPLVLALWACTAAPDPEAGSSAAGAAALPADAPPLDRLRAGELGALAALAQDDDPVGQLAARLVALEPERAAVHAAELPLMTAATEEALAKGAVEVAANRLGLGLLAFPADPRLQALLDELLAAAAQAPDPVRAGATATLAMVLDGIGQRGAAARLRAEADAAALRARYDPARLAETRAAQAGVGLPAALRLFDELDRSDVTALDWGAVAAGGDRALSALVAAPGARAAWPKLADTVLATGAAVPTVAEAKALLDARVGALARQGVPAEVVVAEWVQGALGALDPWSRVVWPAEIRRWQAGHAGVYQGLGLELARGPGGRVVVARPLPTGPAWTSGVHQDDVIVAIVEEDGSRLEPDRLAPEARLAAARDALVGAAGSPVRLVLERDGAPLERALVRGDVRPETLRGWARGDDNAWQTLFDPAHGLAWVAIDRFKPATHTDFDALVAPELDQIRGLVLDLRGNPGGDVNAAVQLADRFIADGLLADVHGRVPPETGPDTDPVTGAPLAEWNEAVPGHALEGVPVVVLVDAETASAAEVLAGALQERAGARVVGAPTWGKGLAQVIHTDPEGEAAAQFTNLVWTLPSGRRLSHQLAGGGGIQPDLPLVLTPGEDFQLDRAATLRGALRTHHDGSPMHPLDPGHNAELPVLSEDPLQLLAQLLLRAELAGR